MAHLENLKVDKAQQKDILSNLESNGPIPTRDRVVFSFSVPEEIVPDDEKHMEEVLEDQVKRGQVVKLSEEDAKRQYPGLVIASLGSNRKEKSDGTITARAREGEERRKNVCLDGGCEGGPSPNPGRKGRVAVAWLPCQARPVEGPQPTETLAKGCLNGVTNS